ncbi:uncharacterized protein LAESUDRAFT_475088 [Laetiporus sulphureus 93-53]|uniref:Uncharacterized protein n=1 Tax=Laetiporus sulphureus 93-53 TaxID=1314785 RepID=A0A165GD04_9APHY|nr:uncharacterized protein LAESUDRAFT_475088 [Laetiporus sulphureus 93-53]KZT10179.1 hypothetical protein LAESUDRAFT_475088 [Laetiporus sulphureus 93-53]
MALALCDSLLYISHMLSHCAVAPVPPLCRCYAYYSRLVLFHQPTLLFPHRIQDFWTTRFAHSHSNSSTHPTHTFAHVHARRTLRRHAPRAHCCDFSPCCLPSQLTSTGRPAARALWLRAHTSCRACMVYFSSFVRVGLAMFAPVLSSLYLRVCSATVAIGSLVRYIPRPCAGWMCLRSVYSVVYSHSRYIRCIWYSRGIAYATIVLLRGACAISRLSLSLRERPDQAAQIGSDRSMIGTGRCMMHHLISRPDVRPIVTCQQAKRAIHRWTRPPSSQQSNTPLRHRSRSARRIRALAWADMRPPPASRAPEAVFARCSSVPCGSARATGEEFSRRGADAGALQRWAKGLCPGRRCGVRGFARDETGVDVDSCGYARQELAYGCCFLSARPTPCLPEVGILTTRTSGSRSGEKQDWIGRWVFPPYGSSQQWRRFVTRVGVRSRTAPVGQMNDIVNDDDDDARATIEQRGQNPRRR